MSEKIELNISFCKNEIEEKETQLKNTRDQIIMWRGYHKAYEECRNHYNELFRQLKYSMDWLRMDDKEKEGKKAPLVDLTEEEGVKISNFIRPVLELISRNAKKAEAEPEKFQAKESLILQDIDRLEKQISYLNHKLENSDREAGFQDDEDDPFGPDTED